MFSASIDTWRSKRQSSTARSGALKITIPSISAAEVGQTMHRSLEQYGTRQGACRSYDSADLPTKNATSWKRACFTNTASSPNHKDRRLKPCRGPAEDPLPTAQSKLPNASATLPPDRQ